MTCELFFGVTSVDVTQPVHVSRFGAAPSDHLANQVTDHIGGSGTPCSSRSVTVGSVAGSVIEERPR
jgi:hypothetical protein